MEVRSDTAAQGVDQARDWSPLLLSIYRNNHEQLVRCAMRVVKDRSIAEDCVQDAIVAFHTKQVRPKPGSELAYIRAMVRNGAISMIRKESRRGEVTVDRTVPNGSAETHAISKIVADEIAAHVAQLAPRQSEVIDLRFGGMSVAESARALSVSSGTIKTHRHRAAATLRESLNELLVA